MGTGFGEQYEDAYIYNAARVAVRRIVKGLSLTGLDGGVLKELQPSMQVLPLVDVQLVLYDTAFVHTLDSSCLPSESSGADAPDVLLSRLKLKAINQVFKDFLSESEGAVGLVGLTWSSEAILAADLLRENQVLVISPSATSPVLSSVPWFARCTSHFFRTNSFSCLLLFSLADALPCAPFSCSESLIHAWIYRTVPNDVAQAGVLMNLVNEMGVISVTVVACPDLYCQTLTSSFNEIAAKFGIEVVAVTFEQFSVQLGKYLHPNCSSVPESKPVVVLALLQQQALELYAYATNENWEWTNVVWIGSESVSIYAHKFPDYFGVMPKLRTDTKAYTDLVDFWSTEAPDIDGLHQLSQVPQGRVGSGGGAGESREGLSQHRPVYLSF